MTRAQVKQDAVRSIQATIGKSGDSWTEVPGGNDYRMVITNAQWWAEISISKTGPEEFRSQNIKIQRRPFDLVAKP